MVAKTDLKARLFDLWGSVVELVRGEKRDGEQVARALQTIKDNPNFAEEFFSGAAKNRSVETRQAAKGVTRLFVDYTRSLAEMLKDGRFDSVNSDITEKHFPITKRPNGKVEMKMFHFNRPISSEQAIQEMDKEGYRPAELPEGLAYVQANPDEQRKYPIILLGSVWLHWSGRRSVPCLDRWSDERRLDLVWFELGWHECYRFLAVRK